MTDFKSEITSIKVNKLYGFLDHNIQLRNNGSTIIYGPNGSGKTTFLKIIYALFCKDFDSLSSFEFESIEVGYADNKVIRIDKIETDELAEFSALAQRSLFGRDFPDILKKRSGLTIKFVFHVGNSDSVENIISLFYYEISDFLKKPNLITNSFMRSDKFIRSYYNDDNEDENIKKENKKKIFIEFIDTFISPHDFYFIDINRTINLDILKREEKDSADIYKVKNYANELSNIIKYAVAKSEETTEKSNKSFPQRMIESFRSSRSQGINEIDIRNKYKETQKEIDKIINMGLLFRENNISLPDENVNLSDNELTVLSIYLSDLNKKIELYKDVVNKIEVFLDIVGNKIRNKTMHINMDKGFYFRSKFTNPDEDLRLDLLSSGEQHQISLFYQLIFLAQNSTFFLIDEPEISLHVDWQRGFLEGLQQISKIRNHRFLIATHSPQIINGNLDLCEPMDIGEDHPHE